jgi:hypothetical protein
MSNGLLGSGLHIRNVAKRRVFVSYHHDKDQHYYNEFSEAFGDVYDVITDSSLERKVDSENVDYVMRRIRENHIAGSSCTIILVGAETHARKYVDWEIKATLDKEHGLIGVRLPTAMANSEGKVLVPDRLYDNIVSKYAVWTNWSEITADANACQRFIEDANGKGARLIDNSRDRKFRNG